MRAKRTISILTVCALGAATAGAVSGCGASATLDPVAQAADVTAQQQGAQIALTEHLAGAQLPPAGVTINGSGFTSFGNGASKLTIDYSGLLGPAASGAGASTATFQLQYPIMYMNFPVISRELSGGKPWIKLNLAAVAQAHGINLSGITSSSQSFDPSQYLNYLRASGSNLQTVGRETIDGVPTTHYHTVIDLSKVANAVPAAQRAAMRASVASVVGKTKLTSFPIDVWVDDAHRVRRERFSITVSPKPGQSLQTDSTVDFTSFGPTPPLTPPPADQTLDLTGLASGGSSS
jgi:hypothetical protein